jgi:hypothetical protein
MKLADTADRRTFTPWAALAVAVAICLHQCHFTLSLMHPESFRMMLNHRCGRVLAGTFLWAGFETVLAFELRLKHPAEVAA